MKCPLQLFFACFFTCGERESGHESMKCGSRVESYVDTTYHGGNVILSTSTEGLLCNFPALDGDTAHTATNAGEYTLLAIPQGLENKGAQRNDT